MLGALIACFLLGASCATGPKAPSQDGALQAARSGIERPRLPRPPKPAQEVVHFQDRDGGLWLSYQDYRALEGNVKALRAYAEELELLVDYYEEVK